jgi:hypothetical protein
MPMFARYEMRHDYLCVEVTGEFSIAAALRQFTEMMEWISGKDVRRMLVDGRELKGNLSTLDRYEYGAFVAAEITRFSGAGKIGNLRLAYVVATSMLDKDRLVQTVARNRGVAVVATDNMNEGLRWLSVGSAG